MKATNFQAFRASILHFTGPPKLGAAASENSGYEYLEDGVLLVNDRGRVEALGTPDQFAAQGLDLSGCQHLPGQLLMPGFIDSHIHYPQTPVVASYGEQLIDWLKHYTFPAELRCADPAYARAAAGEFVDLLLANGTTTAMVYTSVFPESTEAFFGEAARRDLRMIAGKVMMNRNAPDGLTDTVASSEADNRALIERWHNQGRLHYALTPRFAPTSSPEQLAVAGRLYRQYPDLYLQTHLSETVEEVTWVRNLFPDARDYLDVYDQFGLLGPRSVFGHGLHLSDEEVARLAETGSGVAFCPASNLFLGSGLLDLARLESAGVAVTLATDVGAATSFSMLRILADAYKVLQLQKQSLHPLKAFYELTLGNAKGLQLDACLGNFAPGKEADFVVLDWAPTPLQAIRQAQAENLTDALFALMMLGDEHNIARTYILGKLAYRRPADGRDF